MSAGHYVVVGVVLVIALRSPALLPPLGSELLRRGRSVLSLRVSRTITVSGIEQPRGEY